MAARGDGGGRRVARLLVSGVAAALVSTGCATGGDAVDRGAEFQFVAPHGQQVIHYDPPDGRGTLAAFAGPSLLHPGRQVGIQDYPGKVVVLNIWGSWCSVCRTEMDDLQYLDQHAGADVAVLGLDIRDSENAARDFLRRTGVSYDSIFDPPGRALFNLSGYPRNVVPSTIVLDRQHRVAAVYLTRIRLAELTGLVQRLAAEPRS
jgi:thiol-disulfide isomerase/thioredoxin